MNSNIWRTIVLALSLVWCLTMVPFVQASQQTNPDSTGYRWIDNKQPGPSIIYEWIEISAIGTDLLAAPGGLDLNDGSIGSVTIGGTVSPAGGDFEEPVTQSTLKVVGAFHGLSRARSDARARSGSRFWFRPLSNIAM